MTMFFLGILVMSLFAFVAICFMYNNEEFFAYAFAGPVSWVIVGVNQLYHAIKNVIKYWGKRAVIIDQYDCLWAVPTELAEEAIRAMNGRWPNYDDKSTSWYDILKSHIDEWPRWAMAYLDMPNIRYTPKKVWKKYAGELSRKQVKILKENSKLPIDKHKPIW